MHWLIAREGEGVDRFDETHRLTMFTDMELLDALFCSRFCCQFDPDDGFNMERGLIIGVRQASELSPGQSDFSSHDIRSLDI